MVLVDTSVWINHFRHNDKTLTSLLNEGKVVIHNFIVGEIACGSFKNYDEILELLGNLEKSPEITFDEYLLFIKKYKLNGKGIGFVDIHLLASSKFSGYPILTYDKKLGSVAKTLGLAY